MIDTRIAPTRLPFVSLVLVAGLSACSADRTDARPTVLELRPDSVGSTELPPRYDASDVVESLASPEGSFRVHYTRAGRHAVPLADADGSGVPDHVELVARTYDEVLAHYVGMGFRAPLTDEAVLDDNGGDGLFDVYLLDFGGGSDGAFRREHCTSDGCAGYMIQENDFAGSSYPSVTYAVRLLASHELFHAVQAAYDDELGSQGSVLSEGTAVWASERFDASLSDLELLAYGYTSRTDRSLGIDPITAGGAYTYGTGIVFEHLSERHGDAVVRELWEDLAARTDGAPWLDVLGERLAASHDTSFEASFVDLAEWLMFLGVRADAARGPANGARIEPVAAMLVEAPFRDASVRMFPASIRYFAVERSQVAVVLGGAEAAGVDVVGVAFDGAAFAARGSGRGGLVLEGVEADLTLIALVDARTSGSSRVVSLCIDATQEACASAQTDAAVEADGGVADGGGVVGADAGVVSPPGASCACRAVSSRAPLGARGVSLGLALALFGVLRRRGVARRSQGC